eukprot:4130137-Pyramimonas_sp.AAC.2
MQTCANVSILLGYFAKLLQLPAAVFNGAMFQRLNTSVMQYWLLASDGNMTKRVYSRIRWYCPAVSLAIHT